MRLPLYWVPPDEGLWPHLTVRGHLERAAAAAERQRLEEHLREWDLAGRADARPDRLSQGERARLAVLRALVTRAAVLVMDEPLVHVDAARRARCWELMRQRLAAAGSSLVFSTHAPREALAEADRVVCMDGGCVLAEGPAHELYRDPPTRAVAECLGECNWLSGEEAALWLGAEVGGARCYRPEQVVVAPAAHGPLVVRRARFAGSVAEVDLLHEPSGRTRRFLHRPAGDGLRPGTRVTLRALMLLLAMLLLGGCPDGEGRTIAFRQVTYWSLPPQGDRAPAPRSVAIGPEDQVIVLDTAGRVLVYDAQGQFQRSWFMPEYSVGRPEGVCLLQDGRILVSDTHYHRLVFFAPDGQVQSMLGREGRAPGEFIYPVAVTQDPHGFIYVAEYGSNDRVQKFTPDGALVTVFGGFGTEQREFQRPSGIAWRDGKLYVADAINNRIQVFTDAGEFIGVLGESGGAARTASPGAGGRDSRTSAAPHLYFPYDLKFGPDGYLYVVEYGAGRVTRLTDRGEVDGRFGTTGRGEGQFTTPWGLVVDSQGRVRVADTGNRRIVGLEP